MDAPMLSAKFAAALDYDAYVHSGTEEQARRWRQAYDAASLTPPQTQLVRSFARRMHVLVVSGIWCGDCVQQGPLLQRIAEANSGQVVLRLVDRDQHADLSGQLRINGGGRVPVVLFLSEDFELCGTYGERTLSRYRAIAQRQLGASCETGLVTAAADEMAANLQDWLNEFERIQLMLRLSPRLRQRHGD
jgi:thioredoxin-like negative regulator of GroEL